MPIPSLQPQRCTWNTVPSLTEKEVGYLHLGDLLKRDNIPKKKPPPQGSSTPPERMPSVSEQFLFFFWMHSLLFVGVGVHFSAPFSFLCVFTG